MTTTTTMTETMLPLVLLLCATVQQVHAAGTTTCHPVPVEDIQAAVEASSEVYNHVKVGSSVGKGRRVIKNV